jgi:hypothetical protein
MEPAAALALFAAGVFFLSGLLTGIWKYAQILSSEQAVAHPYVDIAHRASLLCSFAALLLSRLVEASDLSATVELWAVAAPLVFFAGAIGAYLLHGALADTDNQFRRPHRLGARTLPAWTIRLAMALLIVAETGGFLVLFWGFLRARVLGA